MIVMNTHNAMRRVRHAALEKHGRAARLFVVFIMSLIHFDVMTASVGVAISIPSDPDAAYTKVELDSSFYARYPYVVIIDDDEDASIDEKFFFENAASVVFKVSKYNLPKDDATLLELSETVLPQISRDSLRVVCVKMRGAASPEGPFSFNRFLSEHRQRALYDYVADKLQLPEGDSLLLETETEDYDYLCRRMEQAGDPDYELVKRLFDKYMPLNQYSQLKGELRAIDNGQLWRRLLVTYFPSLRAARMVIICQRPQASVKDPSVEVVTPSVTDFTGVGSSVVADSLPIAEGTWLELVPRRELLSVKTNLLFYGVYMPGYDRYCPIPNVAVEYYPLHGHFTYGASFDCPWWQHYWKHKYFQIRNYQLETRYYLKHGDIETHPEGLGAAFKGLYFQAYAHAALFGICFDANRGWVGEGGGAGVGLGYVMPISRKGHWRLEFQVQAGAFFCKYDPYQFENPINPNYIDHQYYYKWTQRPELFKKRQYHFSWVGPTRVGITLSYDLLYRKARKGAVGRRYLKSSEPTRHYNPFVPHEKRLRQGEEGGER